LNLHVAGAVVALGGGGSGGVGIRTLRGGRWRRWDVSMRHRVVDSS
jgi:hypothetical protein